MQDRPLRLLAVAAALALLGLNVAFKERPNREDIEEYSRRFMAQSQWIGRLAPDFQLGLTDGARFSMSEAVGKKVVILNFWATWCGPCRDEMPELSRWAKKRGSDLVLLLGIDVGERPDTVAAFLKEIPVTYPMALDGMRAVAKTYEVASFPTTVVVGADGRVALYEVGAILNAEVALDPAVQSGLARLRQGTPITRQGYLEQLRTEPRRRAGAPSVRGGKERLEGRASAIAEAMPCPCGCEERVASCGCQTAEAIKKRLREGGFGGKSDAEVMRDLDREFCVKGKESPHS